MMMFVMAGALLITGGLLGGPWLTGLFSEQSYAEAANEAGVMCPQTLVGLVLVNSSEGVHREGSLLSLDCRYALNSAGSAVATVSVIWADSQPDAILRNGCGQPPTSSPGVFTSEGSYYGSQGQARSDYSGQRRYVNAMESLASSLVKAAESIAAPCPGATSLPDIGLDRTPEATPPGTPVSGAPVGSPAEQATATALAEAQPGTSTPGAGTPTAPAVRATELPPGSCLVVGRVTDADGVAVRGARMTLYSLAGQVIDRVATSNSGIYEFTQPLPGRGTASLEPTDFGRDGGTFHIHAQQEEPRLTQPVDPARASNGECRADFDLWDTTATFTAVNSDIEKWPGIIKLYQNFNDAAALAGMVNAPLEYGLPLPVYAWCDSTDLFCDPTGQAAFAFYAGSTTGREVEEPYIALGFPTSEAEYRGVPDNREYHEFGHAFMADVMGDRIPVQGGNVNHGGYYRNASTTDSWVEGFAEFYSVMVAKHVAGVANPERYLIGAEYNLEEDRLPWEAVGWWEEFTIAGLLLDFEDGDSDYAQPATGLDVESVARLNASNGNFAIGRVRNSAGRVSHSPEVTVELLDGNGDVVFTQTTTVKPEVLGPGQTGVFYVAAPAGVQFASANAEAGRPGGGDDDPIDIELEELMRVITSDWGEGDRVIETAQDLYEVLSDAFAGTPGVTQDDIDLVFLSHGLFDDLNGNRRYDPGVDGEIGGTSHPAAVVSNNSFPARMPRYSADGFEGSFVTINTAGVDAELLVQVEAPPESGLHSYAYWTSRGTTAPVELAVPSADSGGAVTVIAVAEGRNPAVAYRTSAVQFHNAVDAGEALPGSLESSVEMERGNPLALIGGGGNGGAGGGDDGPGGPPWMMVAPVALAGLMLAGGVILMRRSGRAVSAATGKNGKGKTSGRP